MYYLGFLFYLTGYALFTYSIFRFKYIRINYTLGLFVFMTLQFGPHTVIYTDILRLSPETYNDYINFAYATLLGLVYFILGMCFVVAPKRLIVGFGDSKEPYFHISFFANMKNIMILIGLFMCLLSIFCQKGISITLEHLKYLLGSSVFSYTEVRREIFSESLWAKYTNTIRYSITPLIFSYFLISSLITKSILKKFITWIFLVSLLALISVQLNKFFFLYYLILSILCYLCFRYTNEAEIKTITVVKLIPLIILGFTLFLLAVLNLYKFQYQNALDAGILNLDDILDTLLFRVFYASSDSLRLWIDYFGFNGEYKGLGVIAKLCFITNNCFNPNTFIPYYYMGRELTSMQAGFIGSALGYGGWLAIPVVTIFVAGIVLFNNWILSNLPSVYWVYCVAPIMFLNAFFLTTREFHTALLSGGGLSLALFLLLMLSMKGKSIYVNFRHK